MVHLTAAQALLFGERRVTGVEAFTTAPRRARATVDAVVAALQPRSGPRLYRGGTWLDQSSELLSVITRGRLALQGALSLLLVVAAGNLVGALIVFMRRRRAHIAVAMTMGASRREVGAVFLAVAAGVGAVGGIMGVGLTALGEILLAAAPLPVDGALYGLETLPVAISPSSAASVGPRVDAVRRGGVARGTGSREGHARDLPARGVRLTRPRARRRRWPPAPFVPSP